MSALAVGCLIVASRDEGYPEREIITRSGTQWLTHRPSGSLVLADGVSGRVMAKLDTEQPNTDHFVAQGSGGSFLVDPASKSISFIDEADVELGGRRELPLSGSDEPNVDITTSSIGVGAEGMVIAPSAGNQGFVVPGSGDIRRVPVGGDRRISLIGADGAIWSLLGTGEMQRAMGSSVMSFPSVGPLDDIDFTVVGDAAVVLSRAAGTVTWYPDGKAQQIPNGWQAIDAVLQEPSEDAGCAWLGLNDQLLCLSDSEIVTQVRLTDVQLARTDVIVATDSTVVIQRPGGSLLNVDLVTGSTTVLPYEGNGAGTTVVSDPSGAVWIDNPNTAQALVITGRTVRTIDKLDKRAPTFSPTGAPTQQGLRGEVDGPTLGTETAGPPTTGSGVEPDNDAFNEPPVALPDGASGLSNQDVRVHVTLNDYDPDGDPVFLVAVDQPAAGQVEVADTAIAVYRPRQGFVGTDSFTYTIQDQAGSTATSTVTVTVLKPGTPNLPPIAQPDFRETAHARPVVVDVLANDADPEQAPLSIEEVVDPPASQGTVERTQLANGRPALRFIPSEGYAGGSAEFSYRAEDVGGSRSDLAVVRVVVGAAADANHAPIAIGDAAQTSSGQPITIAVLANDRDPDNDELTIQRIDIDRDIGAAVSSDGTIIYEPSATATGTVNFRYVISDRFQQTASAVVAVQIVGPDKDGAPLAFDDSYTVYFGSTQTFGVLDNDREPDSDKLLITEVTEPSVGAVDLVDGREVRYRAPATGAQTQTQFEYTISDGNGNESSAVVRVKIRPSIEAGPPIAETDRFEVPRNQPRTLDLLRNDSDPAGGALSLVGTPTCNFGTCTVTPGGQLLYTPNRDFVGSDEFGYQVQNPKGQSTTGVVLVTVYDPGEQNQAPLARSDDYTVLAAGTLTANPLDNDTDPEGSVLKILSVSASSDGSSVQVAADGRGIVFIARNAPGTTSNFTYRVGDANGKEATGTVGVRILDANLPKQPPAPSDDRGRLLVGQSGDFDVVSNDVDPDGSSNELRVTEIRLTAGAASLAVVGRRSIRVIPSPGFQGEVRGVYTVVDTDNLLATGQLTVTVEAPPNSAPIAANDSATTPAGQPVVLTVLSNDGDPDGDLLSVRLETLPAPQVGVAEVIDGLQVRFTPNGEFQGNAAFSYVAVDSRGLSSRPATISVGVLPCSQLAPIVGDRLGEVAPFNTAIPIELLDPSQSDFTLTTQNVNGGTVTPGERPGVVLFSPTPGNNGGGSFTYTVRNACGISRSARVSIDVNRSPRVSVAVPVITEQNQPVELDIANVATDEEPVVFQRADVGGVGIIEIIDGGRRLRYTPPPDYLGAPELRITVADTGGLTTEGTLRLIVDPPKNLPPVASDDTSGTSLVPGDSVAIEVLGNDIDPDGPQGDLRVQLMSSTAVINGVAVALSVAPDGRRILVDVPAGVQGTGSFSYRAVDAFGARSEPAKVVVYANHAPNPIELSRAVAAGSSTQIDVLNGGNPDPDGDRVSIAGVQSDTSLVTVSENGTVITVTADPTAAGTQATVLFSIVDSYGAWVVSRLVVDVVAA